MEKEFYDLTNPQKSIWYTEQIYSGTNIGTISGTLFINEDVNVNLLKETIKIFINKNDSMRTRIIVEDGNPKQFINDVDNPEIEVLNLSNTIELNKFEKEIANHYFNLLNSELYIFKVFKLENGTGGIISNLHHLIADAWSFGIMSKQLKDIYEKLLLKEEYSDDKPSYIEYIENEKNYFSSEKYQKDKEYWENRFTIVPELACIKPYKNENFGTNANRYKAQLDINLCEAINKYAKENNTSTYSFLMSIYSIYLSRVSGLDSVVMGTPFLNRSNYKEKNTMGMFVNTLPNKLDIDWNFKFSEYIKYTTEEQRNMFRHSKYPYNELLEKIRKDQSITRNLYDIAMSYQNARNDSQISNINYHTYWNFCGNISESMEIHVFDMDNTGALQLFYDYQTAKFSEEEIINIHNRILYMINQVLNNEISLKDIEIVTPEEKQKLLYEFNNTKTEYPRDKTIIDLFEEQVEKKPNNIAIMHKDQKLTYKELNEKANKLARFLMENGIQNNSVVAIILPHSIDMIISTLAILKTGACYLPIDPDYPIDRVEYILNDSNSKLLISLSNITNSLKCKTTIINLDYLNTKLDEFSFQNLSKKTRPEDFAYIIYTSGSTGKPKGVIIKHLSLMNYIYWANKFYCNNAPLNFPLYSSFSFDLTVTSIYTPLICGGSIIIYEKNDIFLTLKSIFTDGISNIVKLTPAHLSLVNEFDFSETNVKKLIVGGDILLPDICNKIVNNFNDIKIYNEYGPTEATVGCMIYEYSKSSDNYNSVPIGKPIDNAEIYILDKNLNLLPFDCNGEMYIGGECLSVGYYQTTLNDEKFIDSPFVKNKKLYKTGDIATFRDKDIIEYVGRSDFQLKLNGFRIESGEIVKNVLKYNNIQDCFVDIYTFNNSKILCAFYVSNDNIDIISLNNFLSVNLPDYMIPKVWTKIDKIPLTINGKVNKKLLPIPNIIEDDIVPPRNNIDLFILENINSILSLNINNINSNLFKIGFDSLSAIKLAITISKKYNINISVKDVLNNPTIKNLTDYIETLSTKKENVIRTAKKLPYYPISNAQKRIYYSSIIDTNSTVYNTSGGIIINKILDIDKLEKCFKILIDRHEALRTCFKVVDNEVVQNINDEVIFNLGTQTASLNDLNNIYTEFVKPFNLEKAPLLRAKAVTLDDNKMLLLLDMHHIISDGTSLSILLQELCDLYNDKTLIEKDLDYKDFTLWEKEQFETEEFKNAKDFWVNQFKDEIPLLNMPCTYSRPSVQSFEGNNYNVKLSNDLFNKINETAKKLNITPYMLMLSTYYILLSKYSSQDDIVVGTPIIGRELPELSSMLGMFVNTLALKNTVNHSLSFNDFTNNIKEYCLSAFNHQNYPFDELVKELNIKKDTSRNPLFDVMFIYQNNGYPKINFKDMEVEYFIPNNNISKFDLSLEVIPINNEYSLRFEYCTKLFDEDFIKRLSSHYINILTTILDNSEIKIFDIDMLSEEERHQILYKFNDTKIDYPKYKTIVDLFEEQVEKTPNNTAVVFEDEKLTYRELNEKANQLAHYLQKQGIKEGSTVGIMLPRSLEILVAILGALKTGACYIPIDPTLPNNRINYMLSNSNVKILITKGNISKDITADTILDISLSNNSIYIGDDFNLNKKINPESPSYMIYTSGSTGTPKGVVLKHKALTNLATYLNNTVEFLKDEYSNIAIASITTISFDIFIFETLICMQKGLKIVIANESEQNTPNLLDELIVKNDVKIIQMTPSRMYIFINNKNLMPHLNNLKYVVLAGEALPKNLLDKILELGNIKIYNGYGPSETTVFSTFTDVTNYEEITIGRPLGNTRIYILDKYMNICPIGIPGEIYIAGDGVGIGYSNNKEMTTERFIQDIFYKNEIMYKTGDLAKYLPNGEISYIGRVDNQIKIRGLRIELDEIENCILKYPNIEKCIITADTDNNHRQYIVAYLSVTDRISINKLRVFLKTILPKYMIPSYFIILDKIPYLNNGKIDKKALPKPNINNSNSEKATYIAPTNKLEMQLVNMFQNLLSISPIGIDDNFFELGGDSLLAINLQVELLKENLNISYSDIFMNPTVRELAKKISSSEISTFSNINLSEFSKFNSILYNTCNLPKSIEYKEVGNILISGTTGFLGAHVLDKFLQMENGIAYCLIRPEPGLTLEKKLLNKLHFYFNDKYDKYIGNRIIIVNADISKNKLGLSDEYLKTLSNEISCVINCAAKVSHYGNYNIFKEINVDGTENLLKFCQAFNKRFYHISTLSVSGNSLVDQSYIEQNFERDIDFKENNFYINQSLDNVYVRSKFEAEKLILQYITQGLDAYILRVGNLMNRYEDGKFQPNVDENAYISRLISFSKIGCIPDYLLSGYMEFTPVDECSKAIIKLIQYPSKQNKIFHLYNHNHVDIYVFIKLLEKYINFDIVSNEEFIGKINDIFITEDSDKMLSGILRDFDANRKLVYDSKIQIKSEFTINYLQKIEYEWPKINENYLKKFIDYYINLNYIKRKEEN